MVVGTVLDILFSSFLQCQTCNFHLSHAICLRGGGVVRGLFVALIEAIQCQSGE
jgi:hypothetical protein